ncbi:hypothetical protein IJ579_03930 [bacterium]|nr:hypothetical protein [bacterium]
MKEKWYNKKLSIQAVIIIILVLVILVLINPLFSLPDIECSRSKDICSIYSRNIILNKTELVDQFNISDIEDHYITMAPNHYYPSMDLTIYFKSRDYITLDFITKGEKRAEAIFYGILNDDNFTLKGNYWKSLFGNY